MLPHCSSSVALISIREHQLAPPLACRGQHGEDGACEAFRIEYGRRKPRDTEEPEDDRNAVTWVIAWGDERKLLRDC